jgi:cytochrome c
VRFRRVAAGLLVAIGSLGLGMPSAVAAFLGHGGPVKGLALTADGEVMVSASFDYSVIVWRLADGAALDVLHGHEAAVNDVVVLPGDQGFATGGDDGLVLLWAFGSDRPERLLEGHAGRVVDLDVSADGQFLASASWDRTVRLWDLATGTAVQTIEGHGGPVNAVRFTPGGERVVTAGADGAVRLWRTADGVQLAEWGSGPSAVHALAVDARAGVVFAAGSAGEVHRYDLGNGAALPPFQAALPAPLFALEVSPDGELLAATGMDGAISLFLTATGEVEEILGGERNPLWSLAIAPDGLTVLAGGNDRTIRQWSLASGLEIDEPAPLPPPEMVAAGAADDEGALVWRRCVACHTLDPDTANRAGPTLFGVFGRPIGTVEGYPYSAALAESDIVWTEATVAELFRLGPDVVTPGTKMPIQRITDESELAALIDFLRREAMPAE